MDNYIGEFAALGTSVAFTFGSTLFTFAGREVGSVVVNRVRLLLALLFIMVIHWILEGQPAPFGASFSHWGWLGLSGLIGFVLGDAFLFQAFVMVGPRLSMLMMALNPVFGVILAWLFLDEQLAMQELFGIALTIAGVAWVVTSRNSNGHPLQIDRRHYIIGILCGLGGAIGQAGGLVSSKLGLEGDFSPLSGNVIRLLSATITIWALTFMLGKAGYTIRAVRDHPRTLWFLVIAVMTGPVIGVWLSLIAVQKAAVGVASTLMSLTPIFLIPVAYVLFAEKVTARAIVGTIIAFVGTAILFL